MERIFLRSSGAHVCKLPLKVWRALADSEANGSLPVLSTFLELLKAFKSDFEVICVSKLGRIVEHFNAQK